MANVKDLGLVNNEIVSVQKTSGTGLPGSIDTYTITVRDGTTFTFNVTNGNNGLSELSRQEFTDFSAFMTFSGSNKGKIACIVFKGYDGTNYDYDSVIFSFGSDVTGEPQVSLKYMNRTSGNWVSITSDSLSTGSSLIVYYFENAAGVSVVPTSRTIAGLSLESDITENALFDKMNIKGRYATLTALQTANPNHGYCYLVEENSHWYYWNRSAWIDGGEYVAIIGSDEELSTTSTNSVQNKAITTELYSFLKRVKIDNVVGKRIPYTIKSGTINANLFADSTLDKFTANSSGAKTFQRTANHTYLAVMKTDVVATSFLIGLWDTTSSVGENARTQAYNVSGYPQLYAGIFVPTESKENSVFVAQCLTISTVGTINALGVIDITSLLDMFPELNGETSSETTKNVLDFLGEQKILDALTGGSSNFEIIRKDKVEGLDNKNDKETFYDYVYKRVFEWTPIVVGGFTDTGMDDTWDARLRLQNYLFIEGISQIKIFLTEYASGLSFKYSISYYSEIGTDRIGSSGWINLGNDGIIDFESIEIPQGAKYMRMILSKVDETTMALNYVEKVLVYKTLIKDEPAYNVIVCDRNLLKKTTATLSNYLGILQNAQSFCKYNNKYISVEEGKITVQSETFAVEETKNISIGHANSIQIGESNFAYVSGWNDNKLYKVNVNTLSVDSIIDLPTTGYTTCAVDELRQIAYIFQRDTYPGNDDNYNFIAYDLANSNTIFSRKTSIAFSTMQSCDYYQDKIIVVAGAGNGNNKYMVFDSNGNLITTYQIPTKEAEEPEGVFIDRKNDGFYISFANKRVYKVS